MRTAILAGANAIAAVTIFRPAAIKCSPEGARGDLVLLAMWSLAYCMTYGLFVVFPQIGVAQLIVCQSLAPAFAAWFSGDISKERVTATDACVRILPIFLLLALAWHKSEYADTSLEPWPSRLLMLSAFCGLVASQTIARKLARRRSHLWLQPRFTFLNAVGLASALLLYRPNEAFPITVTSLSNAIFAAILIVGIQSTYLVGLRSAEPVFAALALSTSVPMSVFAEAMWYRNRVSLIDGALALAYSCSIFLSRRRK